MPKKFKLPEAKTVAAAQANESVTDIKAMEVKKIKRPHIPKIEGRKWTTVQSLFYPYDKIQNEFEKEGLFLKMKDKCWMAIYFDLLLFYYPSNKGPPSMSDKLEGRPFGCFYLDNVVDSDKIKADENKLKIHLPTQNPKDDITIVCSDINQFRDWHATIVQLVKMFETTNRDGMASKDQVEAEITKIKHDIPLAMECLGYNGETVDHVKAPDWLEEIRKYHEYYRKYLPYIEKFERFSAYRVGAISVYCNFFNGRDRDGPLEVLEKAKKKVFEGWKNEVERIIELNEAVMAEDAIDKDHLPFHMEDCQIGVYYIDLMNHFSLYVHGVAPHKLELQKSSQTLQDQWKRLGVSPTK